MVSWLLVAEKKRRRKKRKLSKDEETGNKNSIQNKFQLLPIYDAENMSSQEVSTPVKTITKAFFVGPSTEEKEQILTDASVQIFSDRIFVIITQHKDGKVGAYLSGSVEENIIDGSTTFHVKSLLGNTAASKKQHIVEVYARQITERIFKVEKARQQQQGTSMMMMCHLPPILLGITLSNDGGNNDFIQIIDQVVDMYIEATSV